MLYFKIINGKEKIRDCKVIQLEYDHPPFVAGQYVSNPSQELILADGWQIYVPPVVPPTPMTDPEIGEVMDAVKRMLATSVENLTDEEALQVAALYPTWASKIGEAVNVGERYWYDGKLYKVIQPHTVQEDWTPDTASSLFTEVSIEEWPQWVQPTGAHDAYNEGDHVSHNGSHWISTMDANTYEPGVYGWEARP